MKFTGLIASLAAVSAASAAAIPTAALQPTLNQLSGALGSIDGALGNALGCADASDLVKVQDTLKQIQGELNKLTGTVSQRSVVGNELNTVGTVVSPVTGTVGGVVQPVAGTVEGVAQPAAGTVEGLVDGALSGTTKAVGVKRQAGQLTAVATTLVSQVKDGTLDAAGVEHILGLAQEDKLPLASAVLGLL
ncbi:hypothetical protein P875_00010650 [Aspergillus parasiticus SU-1]|uniref:Hydrophobic surface binding protein A-domain-containing protein n=2 Tax=Aspergillus parasiticus TaxID=5067 RepID=A0A5N6DP03_ASPPA|nr:hypothetical protein BDV34DRAFT_224008 [Aspergillus parasiticus]KJK65108.1 hypothetical protein P875_00010650 [Aspergillus parasiticus SU-1]